MEEYKIFTKQFYNTHAEALARKFKSFFAGQSKEVEQFLKLLPGKRVLDLGCGAGDHALFFQKRGYQVKGIDISERMVEIARSNGVDAAVMDFEHMSFAPNSFDGVWAVTSLLHLKKDRLPSLVDKLHRVLDDGGILYICVKEGRGERYVADAENKDDKRFFAFWEKNELAQLFEQRFTLVTFYEVAKRENFYLEYFFQKK